MSNQNQAVTLTAEQLKEMLVEMAKEIRKPADPTPEQLAAIESDKETRRQQAELVRNQMENKRIEQSLCSHRRPRDSSSTCVYVRDGNYLICQQCQGMIHPEPRPTGEAGKETAHHIYDTNLFNTHLQLSQASLTTFA